MGTPVTYTKRERRIKAVRIDRELLERLIKSANHEMACPVRGHNNTAAMCGIGSNKRLTRRETQEQANVRAAREFANFMAQMPVCNCAIAQAKRAIVEADGPATIDAVARLLVSGE